MAAPQPVATKLRLASNYKPVEKNALRTAEYPCSVPSVVPAVHDLQYYQGVLANDANFADTSRCDIFEIRDGVGVLRRGLDAIRIEEYLQDSAKPACNTTLQIIFCTLKKSDGCSFGSQVSLSSSIVQAVLKEFRVSPQFVPLLLGEPDYWAPGDFATHDGNGDPDSIEFFCQHPRWNIHTKQTPWCVYLKYNIPRTCATYIVLSQDECESNETVKQRLLATFGGPSGAVVGASHATVPFMLHIMIAHESLQQSKSVITDLRHRLYDQLDLVDIYASKPSDRQILQYVTHHLHIISQDADSLLASAEMAIMIAERMKSAYDRLSESNKGDRDKVVKGRDSLRYLLHSLQAQKRWLLSYKSRKDIAMNLVFNLVTQQDSQTNTLIAQDTKRDSSSMKTIAALTMIFLPGTFVSGFFGMSFFQSDHGVLLVSKKWWIYIVITIPLTVITVWIWWQWARLMRFAMWGGTFFCAPKTQEELKGDKMV